MTANAAVFRIAPTPPRSALRFLTIRNGTASKPLSSRARRTRGPHDRCDADGIPAARAVPQTSMTAANPPPTATRPPPRSCEFCADGFRRASRSRKVPVASDVLCSSTFLSTCRWASTPSTPRDKCSASAGVFFGYSPERIARASAVTSRATVRLETSVRWQRNAIRRIWTSPDSTTAPRVARP